MAIQATSSSLTTSNSFLAAANSDNMAGMRMAAPVASTFQHMKMVKDMFKGSRSMAYGARTMQYAGQSSGGMFNGGGISGRFGGLASGGLKSFFSALKTNFAISALLSGISNVYELITGKVKPMQAAGNFLADTAAYTGIGAVSTTIGGFIGSLIPIPILGTVLGVAVGGGIGLLLGKLYEDNLRTKFSGLAQQGVTSLMSGGATPTSTTPPLPTTPAAPALPVTAK